MDIAIHSLHKDFAGHQVLRDINLEIQDVHNVAILGPSGSGKTTLLRILAGLEQPSFGRIFINHHNVPYDSTQRIDKCKNLREYRKRIGVVFQAFNLLPHLNALNNIALPLVKVHGWDKEQAEAKALELLKQYSLEIHSHKAPHQLSGGQKQRVAICRAIAPSPEFLLFDEPTSALDPDFILEVLEGIKALRNVCDFFIITHHAGFARSVADHVLFLDEGQIIEHGSPEQVYEVSRHPRVQNFFANILD